MGIIAECGFIVDSAIPIPNPNPHSAFRIPHSAINPQSAIRDPQYDRPA
jgi:hypothetical protein